MKRLLPLITLYIISCFFTYAKAQDQPIHIAIIPFTGASSSANPALIDMVQKEIYSCFANKDRFYMMDRSQTEKVEKEMERAKSKGSIYASVQAEQGHLAQSEYIITGTINSYAYGSSQTLQYYKMVTQYFATLRLSVQITKVETGRTIYSDAVILKSSMFATANQPDIDDNVMCRLHSAVQDKVRTLFPATLMILKVEKEKKGLPSQVLVNGGSEVFNTVKKSICSADVNIFNVFNRKTTLDVFTTSTLNLNGKKYDQRKVIGSLKIQEIQGEDLALCDITNGAADIKAALDSNKTVLVRIHTDDDLAN